MALSNNPYESSDDHDAELKQIPPFSNWTTPRMVALFFLPWLGLFMTLLGDFLKIPPLVNIGFLFCGCSALVISIFSARVDQRRQNAGWPTLLLMSLVHLIAQTFSIFLAIAFITWWL